MPHNIALLTKLIRRASYWQECSSDSFEAVILGEQNVKVQDAALRSLHPLLPLSLRARLHWDNRHGDVPGFISRDIMSDSVNLFQHGAVTFMDTTENLRVLSCTEALWVPRETPHTLCIRGNALHLKYAMSNGVTVPFVVSNDWSAFLVAKQELDVRYPGWEHRWAVSVELELSAHDTGRYVFAREGYGGSDLTLNDVTFD